MIIEAAIFDHLVWCYLDHYRHVKQQVYPGGGANRLRKTQHVLF